MNDKPLLSLNLDKQTAVVLIVQFILSVTFAYIIFSPFLSAQWGVADDHEIQYYLGTDAKLSFSEIPAILVNETEAGSPGSSPRYRPVYCLLRLVETAVWGDNLFYWYAFRMLLFGASVFIAWHLMSRSLGILAGGVACLPLLYHSTWSDIFGRLGPSEAYCVLALALYALAAVHLLREESRAWENSWWSLLAISSVIAMGSKENMLFILLTTAFIAIYTLRRRSIGTFGVVANVVIISFGLFIVGAVFVALKKQGLDVYGRSVIPESRGQILLNALLSSGQWKIQFPFWATLCFALVAKQTGKFKQLAHQNPLLLTETRKMVLLQFSLLILWYSQLVFYNGDWPGGSRYDFPGTLARDFAYIALLIMSVRIWKERVHFREISLFAKGVIAILLVVAVIAAVPFGLKGIGIVVAGSAEKSSRTRKFTQLVMACAEQAKQQADKPIIFVSHHIQDVELIESVRTLLSYSGVTNPLAIELAGWSEKDCKENEWPLLHELRTISTYGQPQRLRGLLRFEPLSSLKQSPDCFSISFSGYTPSKCQVLGLINKQELF